jgi:hypothetical protein
MLDINVDARILGVLRRLPNPAAPDLIASGEVCWLRDTWPVYLSR